MSRNYLNRRRQNQRNQERQDRITKKVKRSLFIKFKNILENLDSLDIETANEILDLMLSNQIIIKNSNWDKFIIVTKNKCQEFIYDAEYIIFKILGKRPYFEDQTTENKTFQRTRGYYKDLKDYNDCIDLVNKCSEWLEYLK